MKISLTAGWEDFLKIQRDERVILEHTILGIICTRSFHFSPECTKIVSGWGSAPDPAGGAYSAPPDPLAVMGWDGVLVTTFLGCKLCAPLLVAGAPLLFWGWLRACVCACICAYICMYICARICVRTYVHHIVHIFLSFLLNIKSKIICWIIIGGQLDEIVFFLVAFGIAINLTFLLFIFVLIVYAVLKNKYYYYYFKVLK